MLTWEKTGKSVNAAGTAIIYTAKERPWLVIQSKKRHAPHANGIGTWDYTRFYVFEDGTQVKECITLKEAKAFAEGLEV